MQISYEEFKKINESFSDVTLDELGFPGTSFKDFMVNAEAVTDDEDLNLDVYKSYDPEMSQSVILYSNSAGVYGIDPYGDRDAELTLVGWGLNFLTKLWNNDVLDDDLYYRLAAETDDVPNDLWTKKDFMLFCKQKL